jgi:hypothetical protein
VKTVIRTDRAALRSPTITAQGFYRADAHVARAGIYEYRDDDGSLRRELRPLEEVSDPESLASYDTAPVTMGHPKKPDGTPGEVTAENVRRLKVGTVAGTARMDGDHVAATIQVEDAAAIKAAKSGVQELSPGYRIDLDETPGADPLYGYPGNVEGRHDAVQRRIRVNHVSMEKFARGGSTIRLRIDSADRRDGDVDLTTIAKGHQHTIDTEPSGSDWNGQPLPRDSGSTSYAVSEGADCGHDHAWVRGPDGVITIAMTDGHTHAIIEDSGERAPVAPGFIPAGYAARADGQFDRSGTGIEIGRMASTPPPDHQEQIRLLTIRADAADRVSAERQDALTAAASARDGALAELTTARERIKTLEAQIAAGTAAVENAAVQEQRTRADAAELEAQQLRDRQPALVARRADLVAKARAVLGATFRTDGLTERQILVAGVRHLRPKDDVGSTVSEEYLERRFDSLIDDRTAYGASLGRVSQIATPRADTQKPAPKGWADPTVAGAGQFATRKDG